MNQPLKLMALDFEDLTVVSALVQDAVVKGSDIEFDQNNGLLMLPLKRLAREAPAARRRFLKKIFPRHESLLVFSRVTGVRSRGMNRNADEVLSLLAIIFGETDGNGPSGTISLVFAGDIDMAVEVECIEARLCDTGAAPNPPEKPRHAM